MTTEKFRRLTGNSLVYIGGEVLTKGGYFLLIPLYTRYISPEQNGILGGSLAARNFLTIVYYTLIVNIVTRFYHDFDSSQDRKRFLGTFWLALLLQAVAIFGIAYLWGQQFFSLLYRQIPYHPYGQIVIWSGLLMILSDRFGLSLLRVRERAIEYVVLSILAFLAKTLFTVYFVVFRQEEALGALKGELFGVVTMLVPFAVVISRSIVLKWSWSDLGEMNRFGLPLIPHAIASWGLALSDRPILEHSVSLHDLGIYTLGRQFATMAGVIVSAVANAWSPFFMKHVNEVDSRPVVARSAMLFIGAVVCAGMAISLLSPALIRIMADPAYHSAVNVVTIMTLGYIALGLYNVPGNVLSYKKITQGMALATGTGFMASILLNLTLIPKYGITAAALNVFLAYAVMLLIAFVLAYRWNVIAYDWARLAVFAGICVITYILTDLIKLASPIAEFVVRGCIVATSGIIGISYLSRFGLWNWLASKQRQF